MPVSTIIFIPNYEKKIDQWTLKPGYCYQEDLERFIKFNPISVIYTKNHKNRSLMSLADYINALAVSCQHVLNAEYCTVLLTTTTAHRLSHKPHVR